MKINKTMAFFLTLAVVTGCYFLATNSNKQDNTNTLTVGIAAGYAPYISINEDGEYEGFDIDVIRTIASQLNVQLVLKDLGSMTSLMMALDQGSVDAIIWGISITQERLAKYAMIHYQGTVTETYPLIFWNTAPDTVRSLEDLNGFTVCVEPGSSQSAIIERYQNIIALPVEKVDDALLNLQYGKANAALLDPVIATKFKNKFPEIKIVAIPLAPEDRVEGVGITLKKNNLSLKHKIQTVINDLKANGSISTFEKQWNLL